MQALHHHGFPTPLPLDQNRHIVAMSRIYGLPISQIRSGGLEDPKPVFLQCVSIISRLAAHGLIHCDFNEFNLLLDEHQNIILIDFPQMVSIDHPNAEELFERDIHGLVKFFATKMKYIAAVDILPSFSGVITTSELMTNFDSALSSILEKSGFSKDDYDSLAVYMTEMKNSSQDDEVCDEEEESSSPLCHLNDAIQASQDDADGVDSGEEVDESTKQAFNEGSTEDGLPTVFSVDSTLKNAQLIRARTMKSFQSKSKPQSRNSTKKRNKYGRIVKEKLEL